MISKVLRTERHVADSPIQFLRLPSALPVFPRARAYAHMRDGARTRRHARLRSPPRVRTRARARALTREKNLMRACRARQLTGPQIQGTKGHDF